MKELTKQIRKEIKELIEKIGGTSNISNQDKNKIYEKYTTETDRKLFNNRAVEVLTIIDNQIDYFHYKKGI